ncbi:dihydropteroate synthase [Sulfobacillus harzensis]|uniref:Dihydropteroate synthase n=1 Tax=Sulfobacillus harzensis TaxID=2729629 RepID=A0A7Y0L1U6_9FIRM|nr:dihydropteroate synthase [Sulfobacillus harzensis]NMP21472.1 dihydropteroate synthase [Sulfobacillus harzensis]
MQRRFHFRSGEWMLGEKVYILGILNVTPDSFSDGSPWHGDPAYQVDKAERLVADGADGLDLGAESTRPGYQSIAPEEEWARLKPVLAAVRQALPTVPLSIDTHKAWVAERALDAGADIINDIWGFSRDVRIASVTARYGAGAVLMYNEDANPRQPVDGERIRQFFLAQSAVAREQGIGAEALLMDPGIGFRIEGDESWRVLRMLDRFRGIGAGLLVGHSRKRFLGQAAGISQASDRDGVTAVLSALLAADGQVDVLRVHNVAQTRQAISIAKQWRRFRGGH